MCVNKTFDHVGADCYLVGHSALDLFCFTRPRSQRLPLTNGRPAFVKLELQRGAAY